MQFEKFLDLIPAIQRADLPGEDAYTAVMPLDRQRRLAAMERDPDPRKGGVAAIVFPKKGKAAFVLILRPSYQGVHSAQVSFPGGRIEPEDTSALHTALRETEEEVGIPPDRLDHVRELSSLYIPPSRFLVYPHLFVMESEPNYRLDPREVDRVIEFPVSGLLDEASIMRDFVRVHAGVEIHTPYFACEDLRIWGATAMMLAEIKHLILGSLPRSL